MFPGEVGGGKIQSIAQGLLWAWEELQTSDLGDRRSSHLNGDGTQPGLHCAHRNDFVVFWVFCGGMCLCVCMCFSHFFFFLFVYFSVCFLRRERKKAYR